MLKCLAKIVSHHSRRIGEPCGKPAKYGEFCGNHSPVRLALRVSRREKMYESRNAKSKERIRKLEKANTILLAAATFYARNSHWSYYPSRSETLDTSTVGRDHGKTAVRALVNADQALK